MRVKAFFLSKVNWLALITFLLGALPFIQELVSQQTFNWSDFFAAIIGILTFVARTWFTDAAKLTLK